MRCPATPACLLQVSQIVDAVRDDSILVSCTKGILNDTLETPNEILKRVLPPRLHSRSAAALQAAVVVCCRCSNIAGRWHCLPCGLHNGPA